MLNGDTAFAREFNAFGGALVPHPSVEVFGSRRPVELPFLAP